MISRKSASFVVLATCLSACAAASYRLPLNATEAPRYFQPIGVCASEAGLQSAQHSTSVNVKYNESVWIQYMVRGQTYDMVIVGEDPMLEAKKKGDELFACAQQKGPGEMPVAPAEPAPATLVSLPIEPVTPPIEPATQEDDSAMACSYDTQCPKHNCTKGYCRTNDVAALCGYDTHCSSGNCSDGSCQTNDPGAACQYDTHCASRNCTKRVCQTNARGAACQYDTHCTSGNCTNSMCQ